MASRPRCPAPWGSSGEGPIGSWTTASEANRLSQASRSLAATAAWDRRASSRAVVVPWTMALPPRPGGACGHPAALHRKQNSAESRTRSCGKSIREGQEPGDQDLEYLANGRGEVDSTGRQRRLG